MEKILIILKIETKLLFRNPFAVFFNIAFPVLMILMYGSIYGNEPTEFYNGIGTIDASIFGYVAMVIAVAGMLTFPLTLAEYKEYKVYKRFDATPVQKETIIFIQFFSSCLLSLVGLISLLLVAVVGYSVNIKGNLLYVFIIIILATFSLFSFGFFLTSVSKSLKMSNFMCFASYFIMIFLSGASMPIEVFPESIKMISNFLPLTYVVNMLKGVFLETSLTEYYGSVLFTIFFGVISLVLGIIFYRKKSWG